MVGRLWKFGMSNFLAARQLTAGACCSMLWSERRLLGTYAKMRSES